MNEQTSLSYNGLHFCHYKAGLFDYYLLALHAAKMLECARRGLTLVIWSGETTVLLEKIVGEAYIKKLCAICLFKADFNWCNKLIFA